MIWWRLGDHGVAVRHVGWGVGHHELVAIIDEHRRRRELVSAGFETLGELIPVASAEGLDRTPAGTVTGPNGSPRGRALQRELTRRGPAVNLRSDRPENGHDSAGHIRILRQSCIS